MKAGSDATDKYFASEGKVINGWNMGAFFGDRAHLLSCKPRSGRPRMSFGEEIKSIVFFGVDQSP